MKEIVVISGKGGTGKTSITAALAFFARQQAVIADCDVDAADLHLVLLPTPLLVEVIKSGKSAVITPELCINCGKCRELCRFGAIDTILTSDPLQSVAHIVPFSCEGCGVCAAHCPTGAIAMEVQHIGSLMTSGTRYGILVHARLNPGADNSGKLVMQVRQRARACANHEKLATVIIDGPPGIGRPVIASITGATHVLIVTEPTVAGEHDLMRVTELSRSMRINCAVVVNKCDIAPTITERIEKYAIECGCTVLPGLPWSPLFTEAQQAQQSLPEFAPNDPLALQLKTIYEHMVT